MQFPIKHFYSCANITRSKQLFEIRILEALSIFRWQYNREYLHLKRNQIKTIKCWDIKTRKTFRPWNAVAVRASRIPPRCKRAFSSSDVQLPEKSDNKSPNVGIYVDKCLI